MSTPVELSVEKIAAGGAGVARAADGRVVFVHRTSPGDRVEAELIENKRRWSRGRLLRVLEPGPGRRTAPCPLYERCGGCTLEHMQYPAQLAAKQALVRDALERIGGLQVPAEIPIAGSPLEFRYRNRVSFTLRRLGSRVVAGFHELDRAAHVLDVDERCLLPEPAIAEAWGDLRRSWGPQAQRLPAGGALRLTLRGTASGRVTLLIDGGSGRGRPEELLADVPALDAVWHRPHPADTARLLAGEPGVREEWGEESLDVSGALFLQVNRAAAALLETYVLQRIGDPAGLRIVDAYCGIGVHARRLARGGASVVGLELDPHAVAEARRASPEGAEFRQGPVERLLPGALPADLLILNPPRAGVDESVATEVTTQPPRRLIYVSCDPATLARDLARLQPQYHLQSIHCFDLFPQTSHVETVVELACSIT